MQNHGMQNHRMQNHRMQNHSLSRHQRARAIASARATASARTFLPLIISTPSPPPSPSTISSTPSASPPLSPLNPSSPFFPLPMSSYPRPCVQGGGIERARWAGRQCGTTLKPMQTAPPRLPRPPPSLPRHSPPFPRHPPSPCPSASSLCRVAEPREHGGRVGAGVN
ncbi:unnamed protein product [Closterium sp. NIES-54]